MFDFIIKATPKEQIELLVSLPSFGIMIMLVFKWVLERLLPERLQISLGLSHPLYRWNSPFFWYQDYNFVFAKRDFIWLGCWDDHCQGYFIISERYHGKTRIQMLGLRGSAEVVGASILTSSGRSALYPWDGQ